MFIKQLEEALEISNTSVIVVSMQEYYLQRFSSQKLMPLLNNQKIALDLALENELPIIFANKITKNKQGVHKDLHKYLSLAHIVNRDEEFWSCFGDINFETKLQELGVQNLFLMGIYASNCVYKTIQDAHEIGYGISSGSFFIRNNNVPLNEDYFREICKYYIE